MELLLNCASVYCEHKMHQWDLSPFSVSPAASLLARCVSREVVSQEELDSASSRLSPAFSSHLHEAEQRIRTQRQLDQLQLEVELLKMEKESADVTHTFYLTRRFQVLQMFCGHLQDLLKDQNSLRQRLMRPLGRTNLPVQAHLHRFVVDLVKMLLDFIETLEEKLNSVRCSPTARDRLAQLNSSLAQLLAHVAEVESLSSQVLQRKEVHSSKQSDSSA
ncbi:HAUS augmin-like complex subunit 2 isoform X1 [Sebastes fasciatus]|uniref:HAUS augmin-like complex subunit 2 isoform X1 n=2 Tax=Sebastes fasciatus TaxID=394691 RepID=UPI003D9E56DF